LHDSGDGAGAGGGGGPGVGGGGDGGDGGSGAGPRYPETVRLPPLPRVLLPVIFDLV
jgi:hypothetical protein